MVKTKFIYYHYIKNLILNLKYNWYGKWLNTPLCGDIVRDVHDLSEHLMMQESRVCILGPSKAHLWSFGRNKSKITKMSFIIYSENNVGDFFFFCRKWYLLKKILLLWKQVTRWYVWHFTLRVIYYLCTSPFCLKELVYYYPVKF